MRRHRRSALSGAVTSLALLAALMVGVRARAQEAPPPNPPAPAPVLAPEQLDSLVAPIALYPDELLSQVLAACTYPLEVVEAARWLKQNPGLQGEALTHAARAQPWDPSVQALVIFSDVLNRLDENLTWTTALGNAYLDQQRDVMDAVQRMRREAQERGALVSNQAETVTSTTDAGQLAIDIEPADPEVIYVPTYDPSAIWGTAYYPYPVLFYPAGPQIVFGYGCFMPRYYHDWRGWRGWGWSWNWRARAPIVNNTFFYRYRYRPDGFISHDTRTSPWIHDPVHRAGVPYRSPVTVNRFGPQPHTALPAPPVGSVRPAPSSRLPEVQPGQPRERIGSSDVSPLYRPPDRSAFGVQTRDRAEIDSSRGRASMYGSPAIRPAPAPARVAAPSVRPSPPPVRFNPAPARAAPAPRR